MFLQMALLAALVPARPAAAVSYRFKAAKAGTVYSLTAGKYSLRYRYYPAYNRPLITHVNGGAGNWVFTVNGQRVGVSAVDVAVKTDDWIEWKTV